MSHHKIEAEVEAHHYAPGILREKGRLVRAGGDEIIGALSEECKETTPKAHEIPVFFG